MIGLLGAMMTACTEQQRQTENKAQAQLPEPPKREKITYATIKMDDIAKKDLSNGLKFCLRKRKVSLKFSPKSLSFRS